LALVSSQKALGMRLEMSKARISRVVHGARLSVTNCLRLADLLNEPPAVVLRAYRYVLQAELMDRAYRMRGSVPRGYADVHDLLDRLEPDDLRLIGSVIAKLVAVNDANAPSSSIGLVTCEQKDHRP
jgi:hypothetical protein